MTVEGKNLDHFECLETSRYLVPSTTPVFVPEPTSGGFYAGFNYAQDKAKAQKAAQAKFVTDVWLYDACMQARGYILERYPTS